MRKNISVKLFAMMLAVMMVLSLAACGGRDVSSAPAESKKPASSASAEKPSDKKDSSEAAKPADKPENKPAADEEVHRVFQIEKVDAARQKNVDTAGWLYVPNTTIDDPVMQSTDNEAYLRTTEDGQYDIYGSYFADYRNLLDLGRKHLSRNTIIYGHSDYKDNPQGRDFSQLYNYAKDIEFVKNNPYIYFSTAEEDMVWKVFAVFYTHTDFYYINANPTDEEFEAMIKEAVAKSEYIIDEEIGPDDKILTLSTCTGLFKQPKENYRMAVMAKLMPTSEIPVSQLTMEVAPNPNPLRD